MTYYKLYHLIDPILDEVFYIGITRGRLKERLWNHCSRKTKKYMNWDKWRRIQEIRNKGSRPKILLIEENLTGKQAAEKEIKEIANYKRILGEKLTNISPGGFFHTEENLEKLSKRMKGNQHAKGNKISPEHKDAIRQASKKRKFSKEAIEKIRSSKLGTNNPMFGKTLSSEHKRKMSFALKGRKSPKTSKALSKSVVQYDSQGRKIAVWPSQKMASETLQIQNSHISEVCNGKRKTAGGYKWCILQ